MGIITDLFREPAPALPKKSRNLTSKERSRMGKIKPKPSGGTPKEKTPKTFSPQGERYREGASSRQNLGSKTQKRNSAEWVLSGHNRENTSAILICGITPVKKGFT